MTEYAIIYFSDGWRVLRGAERLGRFPYRVDAEEAALRFCADHDEGGAVVLVQRANGRLLPLPGS